MRDTTFNEPLPFVETEYEGKSLVADPLYGYIVITVPRRSRVDEVTEKNIVDTLWVQRMRRIHQLQTAWWVFPAGEHTRFQHSLGAMHNASLFAKHLYPSLKQACGSECPSEPYVEEVLRVAGLLHDSGHGPFCHFCDENYLSEYGINHEVIGEHIITKKLAPLIKHIRRSPSGNFSRSEALHPEHIAFLIRKEISGRKNEFPRWLCLLKPLLCGIFTVDNLDYVQRDAFMCGISSGPVDVQRLLHYSFFTKEGGLTLHRMGLSALGMFVYARLYLYSNVYFHRTTRAIDLQLKEIFSHTMKTLMGNHPPLSDLDRYAMLTEWYVFTKMQEFTHSHKKNERALGLAWEKLLLREKKWKMVYEESFSFAELEHAGLLSFRKEEDYEREIREALPRAIKKEEFKVDIASQDTRRMNPLTEDFDVSVYNPLTKNVERKTQKEILKDIPAKIIQFRVFAKNARHTKEFSMAAAKVLKRKREVSSTSL